MGTVRGLFLILSLVAISGTIWANWPSIESARSPATTHAKAPEFSESWVKNWDKKSSRQWKELCMGFAQAQFPNEAEQVCYQAFEERKQEILEAQIEEWLPALEAAIVTRTANTLQLPEQKLLENWMRATPLSEWKNENSAKQKILEQGEKYLSQRAHEKPTRLPASRTEKVRNEP